MTGLEIYLTIHILISALMVGIVAYYREQDRIDLNKTMAGLHLSSQNLAEAEERIAQLEAENEFYKGQNKMFESALGISRSKATQFESTLNATMAERDRYRAALESMEAHTSSAFVKEIARQALQGASE